MRLARGCGRLVSSFITRWITSFNEMNGLSSTSLSIIFGFLTANWMAVTAPMLLPHTVSLSIFRNL